MSSSFTLKLFTFTPTKLPPIHFSLSPLILPSTKPSPEPESKPCYLPTTKKSPSEETLVNDSDGGFSSDEDCLTSTNEKTSIDNSHTTGKDKESIDSDIPSSRKILSSKNVDLAHEKQDGCHIETAGINFNGSLSSCIDIATSNRKEYAHLNNGFVAEIPDSILKRNSHSIVPYGDLLRVVLSNALTYVADLQDIMRGELALRFPLSPFDSRPAYMRYVRCGDLMLKELEARTTAHLLPPISRRAWKMALEIASATRQSPDFQIRFHPQKLGLDYDEYDGEHPRKFLARSLMILANHPKTIGILRQIAQEFAAGQYDSSWNLSQEVRGNYLGVDVREEVTKGKNPQPYDVPNQKLVVHDLQKVIRKLVGKLQECTNGAGCVQLGCSEMSKIIAPSVFPNTEFMDDAWNATMQVTALQTNVGPVNYTTSYFSASPSPMNSSFGWDSNLAETDDSIFGPNLAVYSSPQVGWGPMPEMKELKYHLVNFDEPEKKHPKRFANRQSYPTPRENIFVSSDTSMDVLSEERTGPFQGCAIEEKKIKALTDKETLTAESGLLNKTCTGPFTNSRLDIIGNSANDNLAVKDLTITTSKSPQQLASNRPRNQTIPHHILPNPSDSSSETKYHILPNPSDSRSKTRLNRHRLCESSARNVVDKNESFGGIPQKMKKPPDILIKESKARDSTVSKSTRTVSQQSQIEETLHPPVIGNWKTSTADSEDCRPKGCRTTEVTPGRPSPVSTSGSAIMKEKIWRFLNNKRSQPNPHRRFDDDKIPINNETRSFTSDRLAWNPPQLGQLPADQKETTHREPENRPLRKNWTPKMPCYRPFENQVHPLPPKPNVTCESLSVPICNPVKKKHIYEPNPSVVSKWQQVIEQVTGPSC